MAKCLRCGAGAEWIQGRVPVERGDDVLMEMLQAGSLARDLTQAWQRYVELFGEPPHGTAKQMAALVELLPKHRA